MWPCRVTTAKLTKRLQTHYCSIILAKFYQPFKCSSIVAALPCKISAASTLQNFCSLNPQQKSTPPQNAASTLKNFCSMHPSKCLQHPPCKMFAVFTLQNFLSIHHIKCLLDLPCKMFAASTLQNVYSIHPANFFSIYPANFCSIHHSKCWQHPTCKKITT